MLCDRVNAGDFWLKQKYLISLFIVTAMAGWLFTGQLSESQPGDQQAGSPFQEDAVKEVIVVRGVRSQAVPHRIELTVRGRTEVNRLVNVRSEVSGRVLQLPVEKGARVAEGDVLCRLALDSKDKNLIEARAMQNQASLEYKGAIDLAKKGLQSEINIAQAKSKLESANASVSRALLALSNTRIIAPFAGIIERQPVEIGDFLNVGGECATILDTDPMLVVGQVAEKDIGQIVPGESVSASLITGEAVEGRISFIGQSADKVTRSYRIEMEVANPGFTLRAGITSELVIPVGTHLAHRISPAILVLDDEGQLGVRTVNANSTVEFHHVEIISEGSDGIWIAGLPDETDLITVGQEVVFAGQLVQIDLTSLTTLVSDGSK
jgi:multidrug efflux system membrane fusion protein